MSEGSLFSTPSPAFIACRLLDHSHSDWREMEFTDLLVAQMVKRLSTMRETQVQSLGWEDPLEKKMATRSSILAWRIPWAEEPGELQSTGSQRVGHD